MDIANIKMMNKVTNDFSTLVNFFKTAKKVKSSKQFQFNSLVVDLKQLRHQLHEPKNHKANKITSFVALLNDWIPLKESVYPSRYSETQKILQENSEEIIFSSFELMEHNYCENTHSNILRYVFHHKFGNFGKLILSELILQVTNDIALKNLILKGNYNIHREFFTENGRIDLLIEDKKNNFIIVIENKILADIAIKEYSEDNTISRTQLDNYTNFISSKYFNYKICYILLSLYPDAYINTGKFMQTDYETLFAILNNIKTENNIIKEYKVLLKSLINFQYDKEWLIELNNKLQSKKKINSLNTFEIANRYFL